jgi:hypothetical protein
MTRETMVLQPLPGAALRRERQGKAHKSAARILRAGLGGVNENFSQRSNS